MRGMLDGDSEMSCDSDDTSKIRKSRREVKRNSKTEGSKGVRYDGDKYCTFVHLRCIHLLLLIIMTNYI